MSAVLDKNGNRFDDLPDHVSIKLGIDLFQRTRPAAFTLAVLLKAVAGVAIPWGTPKDKAKRAHVCPA